MTTIDRWKSGTAALMAMAITTGAITPLFSSAPASAQYNINQPRVVTIPSNVTLPVTYEKEKVIVNPGETLALTLKIESDIIDRNRNVLIPQGTDVVGRLEPVNLGGVYSNDRNDNKNKGVRFVAQELVFPSGRRQQINATSRTYSQTERISQGADTGKILTDAAIGAGAATVISLLTGNRRIETLEPIIGAAAGAGASILLRKKQADVYVLRPQQDLDITLTSSLALSR
ncbi:conjugal transfer protein TrbI [Tolypothrix sp. FACHB-123]|uniref:conjugal transfer protein TrbI n=1 Tax=Tolypothrix sp. FACHB-123 TaxID=2692868 RepID=UPI001688F2DA|nr:conjugal transfer protein TrbI [Tolypothrix sp. FACHB-123]MBD2353281.1 conjugal transfer protein TrbI [Tolypothrix sp. FACHB-123]